jgi:hypothetical protein
MRRASGMLRGIAVHEESAAAEGFRSGCRIQFQDVRSVIGGISGGPCDRPFTLGDGADVGMVLERWIVLAGTGAGISGGDGLAVLLQFSGSLRVSPGEKHRGRCMALGLGNVEIAGSSSDVDGSSAKSGCTGVIFFLSLSLRY